MSTSESPTRIIDDEPREAPPKKRRRVEAKQTKPAKNNAKRTATRQPSNKKADNKLQSQEGSALQGTGLPGEVGLSGSRGKQNAGNAEVDERGHTTGIEVPVGRGDIPRSDDDVQEKTIRNGEAAFNNRRKPRGQNAIVADIPATIENGTTRSQPPTGRPQCPHTLKPSEKLVVADDTEILDAGASTRANEVENNKTTESRRTKRTSKTMKKITACHRTETKDIVDVAAQPRRRGRPPKSKSPVGSADAISTTPKVADVSSKPRARRKQAEKLYDPDAEDETNGAIVSEVAEEKSPQSKPQEPSTRRTRNRKPTAEITRKESRSAADAAAIESGAGKDVQKQRVTRRPTKRSRDATRAAEEDTGLIRATEQAPSQASKKSDLVLQMLEKVKVRERENMANVGKVSAITREKEALNTAQSERPQQIRMKSSPMREQSLASERPRHLPEEIIPDKRSRKQKSSAYIFEDHADNADLPPKPTGTTPAKERSNFEGTPQVDEPREASVAKEREPVRAQQGRVTKTKQSKRGDTSPGLPKNRPTNKQRQALHERTINVRKGTNSYYDVIKPRRRNERSSIEDEEDDSRDLGSIMDRVGVKVPKSLMNKGLDNGRFKFRL